MEEALTLPREGIFETEEQEALQAELSILSPRVLKTRLAAEYEEERRLVNAHAAAHERVRQAERQRSQLARSCQAQRVRIRLLLTEMEGRKG